MNGNSGVIESSSKIFNGAKITNFVSLFSIKEWRVNNLSSVSFACKTVKNFAFYFYLNKNFLIIRMIKISILKLYADVLLWITTYERARAGRPARTYIQQLCEDAGCSPEDLPEAINDREKWRERVRDISAGGTTWWWWWDIVSQKYPTYC